jgi:hypothetical protein
VNARITRAGLSAAEPSMLPGASYINCMPPTSMILPVIGEVEIGNSNISSSSSCHVSTTGSVV